MATTYTPNYNLAQPEVGGEIDTWGGLLNVDLMTIDTTMKAISDVANAALPKAGGVATGNLSITKASGNPQFTLSGVASTARGLVGATGAATRWQVLLGDGTPESGSNSGSNLGIERYNDAGAYVGTALVINRASGAVSTSNDMTVGANLTVSGGGVFNAGQVVIRSTSGGMLRLEDPTGGGSGNYLRAGNGLFASGDNISWIMPATGDIRFISPTLTPSRLQAGAVFAAGVEGGFVFADRTSGSNWAWYADANTARLNYVGADKVSITTSGVVSAADFTATSDVRLKTDVEPLRNATERLKQMRPRTYRKEGRPEAGWIAQEVERALATAVSKGDDGYLRVSPGQISALVAACLLEVEARVTALEELI